MSLYLIAAVFAAFGMIVGVAAMFDSHYLAGVAVMCFSLAIAVVSVPILIAS